MPIQKNLDGQENILYWARRKNYLGRNLALFEPKLSYSSTVATKKAQNSLIIKKQAKRYTIRIFPTT